jgi:hypothetical protein
MADTATKGHTAAAPLSKDEYLEKTGTPLPGFTKTLDSNDANIGQTVHDGITRVGNDLPGQVFETWQLPDPQKAIDAGLPPVAVPAHLIVEEDHVQGPDALDLLTREMRENNGNPRLNDRGHTVVDGKGDEAVTVPLTDRDTEAPAQRQDADAKAAQGPEQADGASTETKEQVHGGSGAKKEAAPKS